MGDFLASNWQWLATSIFFAGVFYATQKSSGSALSLKIDTQTEFIRREFLALQKKDDEHDQRLNLQDDRMNGHSDRIVRLETRTDGIDSRLEAGFKKVDKIYTKIMGS